MSYADFLAKKKQLSGNFGFEPTYLPDTLFPFQKHLVEWAVRRGRAAIFADCGLGKAQRVDQRILTPDGWVEIGSAKVGMQVYGSDGLTHSITGVFPQGVRKLAQVTFTDGSSTFCDWDHLWFVMSQQQVYHDRPGKVMKTSQIASGDLRFAGCQKKYFVPLVKPLVFNDQPHFIDPYTLGVILGDGCIRYSTCKVTCPDFAFTQEELPLPTGCRWSEQSTPGRCKAYSIVSTNGHNSENLLTKELRRTGLHGHRSESKFIPREYLFSSVSSRLAILQGLLDTDGYASGPCIEFSTASKQLSDDVVFIVRSLGGTATQSREPAHYVKSGERFDCLDKYRSVIKLPSTMNPFRLKRKAEAYRPIQRKEPYKAIESIVEAGEAEAVCISVDAPDSLYVTEGVTLTHNTVMQLSWCENTVRHTNKPALLLTPLAVSHQIVRESQRFGIEAHRSDDGTPKPNITVTNYERLKHFNPDDFGAVSCDEASIVKHWSGATQKAVTRFLNKMPYRLLCTATPAPNDYTEMGTISEALGELSYSDMIEKFFRQISDDEKRKKATADDIIHSRRLSWRVLQSFGNYALKAHAFEPFWRWISAWARACRKPSDVGPFSDAKFILPPLNRFDHMVEARTPPPGHLFNVPAFGLNQERAERRRTLDERSELVVELTNPSDCAVVWCQLNDEGDRLEKDIPGSVQVKGTQSLEQKEELLLAFLEGQARVLVTKPKIAGLGLNLQHCAHVVTFVDHSYEKFYQCVRRCWRFGQKRPVRLDVIATSGEINVKRNMDRKEQLSSVMFDQVVKFMNDAMNVSCVQESSPVEVPSWLSKIN